jgi:hypothetical protein
MTTTKNTNTISNANRYWNTGPYCTWDVQDSTGKSLGCIDANYDGRDIGVCTASYTYTVDYYEVNIQQSPDDGGYRVFIVQDPAEFEAPWCGSPPRPSRVRLRRLQDRLHLEGVWGVGQFETHPTARKALAAAKKFAREFTPSN